MRVLVAEDNTLKRKHVRGMLELDGHEVIEACDGLEVLLKVEAYDPSVVFLNTQMPLLNGFHVVRKLRNDPRFATLRVVALTASAAREEIDRVNEAGFNAYITNPIDAAQFCRRLESNSDLSLAESFDDLHRTKNIA